MKVFVIADPQTHLAFALAGVRGKAVFSAGEVPAVLESVDTKQFGLILIAEHLAEKNREAIDKTLLEPDCPLILEIPAATGPPVERVKPAERILSLMRK
jgi:vacuolar-type H+-ATPase subunit F/Vma7